MGNRKPRLGDGIYTASDAAKILRIPFKKSKDWFQYYVKHRLFDTVGYRYYFDISDIVAVDFLTLITMVRFFNMKKERFSTKYIVKVHKNMVKGLDTPYPFANKNVWKVGSEIYYGDEANELINAITGQPAIPGIYNNFAKKMEFDNKLIAHKYYPLGKNRRIVIDPNIQFGLPTVKGTRIITDVIYNMVKKGVGQQNICKTYDINLQTIQDVIEFSKAA